jgi:hypothetical protein
MQSEKTMKLGLYVRNMGPQSTRPLLADAARAAEEAGIDDLWVADHLALAPEDAEGSDGIASLREGMAAAGKPVPEVVLLQPLPVDTTSSRPSWVSSPPGGHTLSVPGATGMPRRSPASPRASSPPARPTRRRPEGSATRARVRAMLSRILHSCSLEGMAPARPERLAPTSQLALVLAMGASLVSRECSRGRLP